jgi:hypothetical protein
MNQNPHVQPVPVFDVGQTYGKHPQPRRDQPAMLSATTSL